MNNRNSKTEPAYWSKFWSNQISKKLVFNPNSIRFRDLHKFFTRNLPRNQKLDFLEIGCFPGKYLWYFSKYFGYRIYGIEYVEWCCERSRTALAEMGIDTTIYCQDFLQFNPPPEKEQWDVVASFGFIEHFENFIDIINRHMKLVKPGGFLVFTVPNLHGVNGKILRKVDARKFKMHKILTYRKIKSAMDSNPSLRIIEGGYYGHVAFWNTGLYRKIREQGKRRYFFVRGVLWVVELFGLLIPNSRIYSPIIVVLAKKENN